MKRAAKAGEKDADATYLLSQLYLGAAGPEKQNDDKGFELLKQAAKGGNASLADVEVERAVVFMGNKAGGSLKDPPAPKKK